MRTYLGILLMGLSVYSFAEIKGEVVEYKSGATTFKGYLAYDDAKTGERPGVLVVHEWWGHNEYARTRARMLAEMGFTALAVDMYGDGKQAKHPKEAGEMAGMVMKNMPLTKNRFLAAKQLLEQHATTNDHIAAVGYCFGGGVVLNMARMSVELDGVVSVHGSLKPVLPAKAGAIKTKILVLNGLADPFTTKEHIDDFNKEMQRVGAEYKIIHYPGAKHAFTNPEADKNGKKFNLPLAYDAKADKASWHAMQEFFQEIFKQ